MIMTALGWYERTHDEKNGEIQDTVKMEIKADTEEERLKCLNHMMILHEVFEEYEVFKDNS